MIGQVFIISEADFKHLGAVRALNGLQAARKDGQIWLSGIPMPEDCPEIVIGLPAIKRFRLDGEARLFAVGDKIPSAYLPKLDFIPIAEFVQLELPSSAFAGKTKDTAEIRLRPSMEQKEADLLLCSLDSLQKWADAAPQIRIDALRFAAAKSEETENNISVFVQGLPLPNIPGKTFWKDKEVYLPSGMALVHPFLTTFLKQQCDPEKKGTVILTSEINFELILASEFVPASRSGIRKT